MKKRFDSPLYQDYRIDDLQERRLESTDHSGLIVASFSALIIILIGTLTEKIDIISTYFEK